MAGRDAAVESQMVMEDLLPRYKIIMIIMMIMLTIMIIIKASEMLVAPRISECSGLL